MKIISVIPAKIDSTRIPHKNIKILGNKPLVQWAWETQQSLLETKHIDGVFVYADSVELNRHLPFHAKVVVRDRNPDSVEDLYLDMAGKAEELFGDVEYMCVHQPTSPFITPETVIRCLAQASINCDCAFTVQFLKTFWWNGREHSYDIYRVPPTQDIVPLVIETTGVYVCNVATLRRIKSRVGLKPSFIKVSPLEAIDIDYPGDWELARIVANGLNGKVPFTWLCSECKDQWMASQAGLVKERG